MNNTKQLIYILGDIHGEFQSLNTFINNEIRTNKKIRSLANDLRKNGKELEIIFLQVGDFAFFWPGKDNSSAIKNAVEFLKDGYVKIFWPDGNHEDHNALDDLERRNPGKQFIEVAPCVYFATFGSMLTLVDETNVLFVGGAESCDIFNRKEGLSWWRQEGIDDDDMSKLPAPNTRIDWVISHTGPISFEHRGLYFYPKKYEQSRKRLEIIREKFHPKRWFFGHFHDYATDAFEGCHWTCLNHIDSDDIWYQAIEFDDPLNEQER